VTPDEMLAQLKDDGITAGADYHDGLDGWFGWDVDLEDKQLIITWYPQVGDGPGEKQESRFFLLYRGF
jgi:hypothetical protein